jgi:uncharacterized delta-60 repeat protein
MQNRPKESAMSKEAKSGELEYEFRFPLSAYPGSMLPLANGGMYLTGSLEAGGEGEPVTLLVARVDAEGNPDVGFGTDGVATVQVNMGFRLALPWGVMRGPNGTVTAALVLNRTIGLARFKPGGSLDLTFGRSGTIVHDFERRVSRHSKSRASNDPRVIVDTHNRDFPSEGPLAVGAMDNGIVPAPDGGSYFVRDFGFGGPLPGSILVHFDANGFLDTSFGDSGVVYIHLPGRELTIIFAAKSVEEAEGNKIVVVGWAGDHGSPVGVVARFHSDGTLDDTFGEQGFAVVEPPSGRFPSSMLFTAVHVMPDGNIFASGRFRENDRYAGLLAGLDSTGKLRPSFNRGEAVIFDPLGADEHRLDVNVFSQSDGKIVVVGSANSLSENKVAVLVARYMPDGSLDRSFAVPKGWTTVQAFGSASSVPSSFQFALDGKILIAGYNADSPTPWVMRLSN